MGKLDSSLIDGSIGLIEGVVRAVHEGRFEDALAVAGYVRDILVMYVGQASGLTEDEARASMLAYTEDVQELRAELAEEQAKRERLEAELGGPGLVEIELHVEAEPSVWAS